MSIVANLGLSTSFTTISADLIYPAMMRIVSASSFFFPLHTEHSLLTLAGLHPCCECFPHELETLSHRPPLTPTPLLSIK